ncbi:DUF1987 domain-containing protein [Reichenbachiella sp.]|uniref:DUF1987 domain-containing protein n=1 Tax=Reichenbachiella sp. TaxID=2184521 RepID=UPI0032995610
MKVPSPITTSDFGPHHINQKAAGIRKYVIEATNATPSVNLLPDQHFLMIKGRCSLVQPMLFYKKVLQAIDQYAESGNDSLNVFIKFEDFNSTSTRCILDMMKRFQLMHDRGVKINVSWYYDKGDDIMLEYGQIFKDAVHVRFNLVEQ